MRALALEPSSGSSLRSISSGRLSPGRAAKNSRSSCSSASLGSQRLCELLPIAALFFATTSFLEKLLSAPPGGRDGGILRSTCDGMSSTSDAS